MTTGRFISCLLVLLSLLLSLQAKLVRQRLPLHRRMNLEMLKRTFHVDDYDKVPPYEVARVRGGGVSKRSAGAGRRRVRLTAFGRDLRLNLRRNSEFEERLRSMKMYLAESTGRGIQYKEMPLEDDDPGTAYHDLEQMAAVTIRHGTDGKIQMEGTIGEELVVRPVPDDELFLDEEEEERGGASHVVFRAQGRSNESRSDFLPLEASRGRGRRAAAPASVWPEILLLVDHGSFALHGLSSRHVKRYFVSFWNGVDLRYKTLSNPKIRISLAGIIVAKSEEATPYLERNRLPPPNRDAVDAAAALTDLGKYLYLEDRLPAYDLAVVMTKLDMCRKNFGGGRCSRGTAGFAYVGGACVVNKRLEKVNSVAVIEDSGGFSGIIVAAHEVGHLLGCVHDGSPPPSYLGGPGAGRCPWEDGFIMSDLRHTDRGFRWSACSAEQFRHFLGGETASCLHNYPDDNKLLARELPGAMLTLDEQCERDRGSQACFKDSRVCAQLFCYDNDSGYCVSFRPAAEGSSCGDGQVCKNGQCIVDNENIIPDHTHVTSSIANRADKEPSGPTPAAEARRRPPPSKNRRKEVSTPAANGRKADCEDAVEKLAGGLSCRQFLQRYGDRYCRHGYMTRNCCRSHGAVCAASP